MLSRCAKPLTGHSLLCQDLWLGLLGGKLRRRRWLLLGDGLQEVLVVLQCLRRGLLSSRRGLLLGLLLWGLWWRSRRWLRLLLLH